MADRLTSDQLNELFQLASGLQAMPADWTPAGAWVRVSSGAQDEALQVPQVIAYMVTHQLWPARWYVVHAKSAFHGKHQADLNRAITDMRHGATKVLVIWHSDRLERRHDQGKSKTLPNTLAEFIDAGGHVESVQEPQLGQTDFGGQITTYLASLMNNEKSKHISEQVKLAIEDSKANGAVYNNAPWGFDIVGITYNKGIVPTDDCREYVPQIFARCIQGDSLRTIAAWLDSEGVKTKRGGKWNESAVRWIIKNRAYAGTYLNREGKAIAECEAVVSPSIFDRANAALKTRPKRGKPAKDKPLLAKLKCARCGSPMYRLIAGATKRHYYYRCFGSGPQRKGCGNMVDYAMLESMVVSRMSHWNDAPYQTSQWIEGQSWDDEISNVNHALQEQMKDLLADDAMERIAELRSELAHYTQLNETRELGHYAYTDVLNDDGSVKTRGQHFSELDFDGRREWLTEFDIRAEKLSDPAGIRLLVGGLQTEWRELPEGFDPADYPSYPDMDTFVTQARASAGQA